MNNVSITAAIPHRPPMLLIDEVVSIGETEIVCRKTFRGDEFFLQGHYPGLPIVPGVILCECAAQSGAVLISSLPDGGVPEGLVPVLTRMNNVKFKKILRPGDTVEIQASIRETVSNVWFMNATVRCEGKIAATLDFACASAPAPEHQPPANGQAGA